MAPSDADPGGPPAFSFLGAPASSRPAPGSAPGPAGWNPSSFGAGLAHQRGTHAGATTDTARTSFGLPELTSSLEMYLAAIAKELGKQGRHHEDAAGATKGTLASIGREAGQCVFITRIADHLTVSLCPGIVEKEALHAPCEAGEVARPLFRKLQLRVNLTNAVCYACAGFAWGGRDHRSLPDHCVSVANFPEASEEQLDNYRRPHDLKVEARPRHPATAAEWVQAALRQSWVFACFHGEELYTRPRRRAPSSCSPSTSSTALSGRCSSSSACGRSSGPVSARRSA